MWRTIPIFVGVLLLAGSAPAEEKQLPPALSPTPAPARPCKVDTARLRELAYLPPRTLFCKIGDPRGMAVCSQTKEERQPATRIDAAEKELQGDASDAELYLELGDLENDQARSDLAFAKAAELFKQRLMVDPTNGRLMSQYACAIGHNTPDAEKAALEAIRLAPADWWCWDALARIRSYQMWEALAGTTGPSVPWVAIRSGGKKSSPVPFIGAIEALGAKPGPEQLARAKHCLAEELKCRDKAVSLASRDVDAYWPRLGARYHAIFAKVVFGFLEGDPHAGDTTPLHEIAELTRDARKIARLCRDDPEVLGSLLFWYLLEGNANGEQLKEWCSGSTQDRARRWREALPVASQQGLKHLCGALNRLTRSADSAVAEAACSNLAMCRLLTGDLSGSEKQARQATARFPKSRSCWFALAASMEFNDRKEDAREVCQQLAANVPSCLSQEILAHACWEADRLHEAEQAFRTGLEMDPSDIPCKLGLIAVLLRKGDEATILKEVQNQLTQVFGPLIERGNNDWIDAWRFHHAMYLALDGQFDASRQEFRRCLQENPKNEAVQEALKLFSD